MKIDKLRMLTFAVAAAAAMGAASFGSVRPQESVSLDGRRIDGIQRSHLTDTAT